MRRGSLLVCLLLGGCGQPPAQGAAAPGAPPAAPVDPGPSLQPYGPRTTAPGVAAAGSRNPFDYATRAAGRPDRLPPLPPPDGLPELPLPLAQPPLRLLGLVTEDSGQRIAVIGVGADLVLARTGEQVAGRFSVTAIGEETVELADTLAGHRTLRLTLP